MWMRKVYVSFPYKILERSDYLRLKLCTITLDNTKHSIMEVKVKPHTHVIYLNTFPMLYFLILNISALTSAIKRIFRM